VQEAIRAVKSQKVLYCCRQSVSWYASSEKWPASCF